MASERTRVNGRSEEGPMIRVDRWHGTHLYCDRCGYSGSAACWRALANAIRISPMTGCTDIGTVEACREYMTKMAEWLDKAEQSGIGVAQGERVDV